MTLESTTAKGHVSADELSSMISQSYNLKELKQTVDQIFNAMFDTFGQSNASRETQKLVAQTLMGKKGEKVQFFFFQPQPLAQSSESTILPLIKIGKSHLKSYVLQKGHTKSICSPERIEFHEEGVKRGIAPKIYRCKSDANLYVMKFMNQGDLCQFLQKNSGLGRDARLHIALEICRIVHLLHDEMHVYHRDIKLENFLVDIDLQGSTHIYISDFGFASESPYDSTFKGTIDYCSPESEKLLHKSITEEFYDLRLSDLYSLGATLFSLLTNFNIDEEIKKYPTKENEASPNEVIKQSLIMLLCFWHNLNMTDCIHI